ncbi:MAG: hypothetical protein M1415_10710 [Firmicutes bacterium]|jgi:hypothetical protein|nr:hypothetical protein [Bacillota bacterium]MCL5065200.1 hypothetical protein [Bacillota bacterium]
MTNLPSSGQGSWKIYRTTDGGLHWIPVFQFHLATNSVTSAPFFVKAQDGFHLKTLKDPSGMFRKLEMGVNLFAV